MAQQHIEILVAVFKVDQSSRRETLSLMPNVIHLGDIESIVPFNPNPRHYAAWGDKIEMCKIFLKRPMTAEEIEQSEMAHVTKEGRDKLRKKPMLVVLEGVGSIRNRLGASPAPEPF